MSDPNTPAVDDESAMQAALQEIQQARKVDAGVPAPAAASAPVVAEEAASAPVAEVTAGTAPAPKPETTSAAPAAAPAAPAATPAAEETPEQKLARVQSELQRAQSELGRVSALNRKAQELTAQNATLARQLEDARKPPSSEAEARTKLATLAETVKDFPELHSLVTVINEALQDVDKRVTDRAKEAAQQAVAPLEPLRQRHEHQVETEAQAAYTAAKERFDSTYGESARPALISDDFKQWLPKQSTFVRAAFHKGDHPDDALTVMDAYDADRKRRGLPSIARTETPTQTAAPAPAAPAAATPAPNRRLESAAGLPSRPASGAAKGGLPPADDFDASVAYWREKRLSEQRRAA